MAQENGWPNAIGFASGDFGCLGLNIIESMEIRNAYNSSPPEENFVTANAERWDCGGW